MAMSFSLERTWEMSDDKKNYTTDELEWGADQVWPRLIKFGSRL